jgi:hypothetical protein
MFENLAGFNLKKYTSYLVSVFGFSSVVSVVVIVDVIVVRYKGGCNQGVVIRDQLNLGLYVNVGINYIICMFLFSCSLLANAI